MIRHAVLLSIIGLVLVSGFGAGKAQDRLSGWIVVASGSELTAVSPDGADSEVLVDNGCQNTPTQAVGRLLIFHSRGCPEAGTNALDLLTGEARHLAGSAGLVSPDGRHMAEVRRTVIYTRYTNSGPYDIVLWDLEAGTERVIGSGTHFYVPGVDVAWSPDGKRLAYERGSATSEAAIAVFDVQTGETHHLADADHAISAPAWSPDGRLAFYAGRVSEEAGVYVVDEPFEWAGAVLVGSTESSPESIHWSPDGATTAYVAWTSYFEELRLTVRGVSMMDMDSGESKRAHPRGENGFMPSWSADGSRLAYVSNQPEIAPVDPNAETISYRIASFDYHLHVVDGEGNRIVYTCDTCTLESPVWLP